MRLRSVAHVAQPPSAVIDSLPTHENASIDKPAPDGN
jgi:hypothetical protein